MGITLDNATTVTTTQWDRSEDFVAVLGSEKISVDCANYCENELGININVKLLNTLLEGNCSNTVTIEEKLEPLCKSEIMSNSGLSQKALIEEAKDHKLAIITILSTLVILILLLGLNFFHRSRCTC